MQRDIFYSVLCLLFSFSIDFPLRCRSTFIDPLELKNLFNSTPSFAAEVKKQKIQNTNYVRFRVSYFPKTMEIAGRTVSCHEPKPKDRHVPSDIYAQPTWLCNNITVDGHHLPFYYSADSPEMIYPDVDSFECGKFDPYHAQLKLCFFMLQNVGFNHADVHSYTIDGGSCHWAEKKIILKKEKAIDKKLEDVYYWETTVPGHGYATSILCGVKWT